MAAATKSYRHHPTPDLVPIPHRRQLDWTRILKHVPLSLHLITRHLVLTEYLDLFIDGDHKITWSSDQEELVFSTSESDWLEAQLHAHEWMSKEWAEGRADLAERRRYMRASGMSLDDAAALPTMGHHGKWKRALDVHGNVALRDCPAWLMHDDLPTDLKRARELDAQLNGPPAKRTRRAGLEIVETSA